MSLHRDPGIKRAIGAIDKYRYASLLFRRILAWTICVTLAGLTLTSAWKLLGLALRGWPVNPIPEFFTLIFGIVGGLFFYGMYRLSAVRKPTSVAQWIPGDPSFAPDPDITAAEWAALRSAPGEALLRDLYERPAARNRIADEAASAPAASFEAFKAQAAGLIDRKNPGPAV